MSPVVRKSVFGFKFPTRYVTNWNVQLEKLASGFKFRIEKTTGDCK